MSAAILRVATCFCLITLLTIGGNARAVELAKAVTATLADEVNVNNFTIGAPAAYTGTVNTYWVQFSNNASFFSDGFGYMARDGGLEGENVVDASPAVNLMDDSVSVFTPDTFGIVGETDFDNFFGITDTVNGDVGNPDQGTPDSLFTATWEFDITGHSGALELSIDAAAMGDFEAFPNDQLDFEVSYDGVNFTTAFFSNTFDTDFVDAVDGGGFSQGVDLTLPGQDIPDLPPEIVYTLDTGLQVAWNDALTLGGEPLSNEFETVTSNIGTPTSNTLYVRFLGNTGSGSEVFAFRNITVDDGATAVTLAGDYNDDGTVDAADYTVWRDALETGATLANETVGLGTVSIDDYLVWEANFGSSVGPASSIPEPASALLAAIALAGLAARRNG